jgi:hypothetical protein
MPRKTSDRVGETWRRSDGKERVIIALWDAKGN